MSPLLWVIFAVLVFNVFRNLRVLAGAKYAAPTPAVTATSAVLGALMSIGLLVDSGVL